LAFWFRRRHAVSQRGTPPSESTASVDCSSVSLGDILLAELPIFLIEINGLARRPSCVPRRLYARQRKRVGHLETGRMPRVRNRPMPKLPVSVRPTPPRSNQLRPARGPRIIKLGSPSTTEKPIANCRSFGLGEVPRTIRKARDAGSASGHCGPQGRRGDGLEALGYGRNPLVSLRATRFSSVIQRGRGIPFHNARARFRDHGCAADRLDKTFPPKNQ
jgi:hypothetical protein